MSVVDAQEEFKAEVAETFEDAGLLKPAKEPKSTDKSSDGSEDDDFRARVWNAEQECRRREITVELLKGDLKAAKEEYDSAVERLRRIASEGSQPNLPIFGSQNKEDEPLPEPSEAWRDRPFMPWLETKSGIRGVGVKKKDALYEVVQTFGDFEDLRVKAQEEGKHLSELLPKGFGEEVTDAIVNAFLVAKDEPYIDRFEPLAIITNKTPVASRKELEQKWIAFKDVIHKENLIGEISLEDCDLEDDCSNEMQDGFEGFENGLAVHACDADTVDGQNDWVYGWCLAERKEQLMIEAEKQAEAGS